MLASLKKITFTSSGFLLAVILSVFTNLVTSDEVPLIYYVAFWSLVAVGAYADYRRQQKEEAEKQAANTRDARVAEQVDEMHRVLVTSEFVLLEADRQDVSSLPNLHPHFVGRTKEIELLDTCWQNPASNVLELVAPGGTGKTTLVTWWLLNRLPDLPVQPERIFAFSFYSQGTDEQRQSSSDPFFSRAAAFFGLKNLPTDPRERARALVAAIRQSRCLLVLDGVEPLQYAPTVKELAGRLKDPALRVLLKDLASNQPGLCICTTRLPITELIETSGVKSQKVENLDEPAGVDLLQKLNVRGSDKEMRAAVQEYKGHALALRLLGNYLGEILNGDVRRRKEIPHLTDEEESGGHARRVMEAYVTWFTEGYTGPGLPPETALLHLLGIFDRSAPSGALDALLAPPDIAGLTESLHELSEVAMRRALNHLEKLGLLTENLLLKGSLPLSLQHLPTLKNVESLDAHPLVREHFGQRLEEQYPDTWREANLRLFEYYCALPEKHLPDTEPEMQPLFLAMTHGCRAGEQQRVLDEVYWERIKRGHEHYSTRKLGVFGADLTALSQLFEKAWVQPSRKISEPYQAVVLGWVGFRLLGLGRLIEAVEPMRAGLEANLQQKSWENAAADASNLSELYLALGCITESINYGEMSVAYADQSEDWGERVMRRANLADALHQAGQLEQAQQLFEEAEKMQKERQPEYRFLYSVRGYRYCDLLLGGGQWEVVLERAEKGLIISNRNNWLLGIAVDQLSMARAYALAYTQMPAETTNRNQATHFFDLAVAGLRKAGIDDLPRGLLHRAAWRTQLGQYTEALEDLKEVFEIADGSQMGLYLADYHLEMGRWHRAQGQDEQAEKHKIEALTRIHKMGYRRRLAEAEAI